MAYDNAKQVAAHSVSQQEVDYAWVQLISTIHKLGFQAGDKEQLRTLVSYAEGLRLKSYADGAAKHTFIQDLAQAKTIAADWDALQYEVAQAEDQLTDALLALRFKADKSVLQGGVSSAGQIDLRSYTAEHTAVFMQAYENAVVVLDD